MRSGTGAAILVATAALLLLAWPEGGVGAVGAPKTGAGGASSGGARETPARDGADGGGGAVTGATMPSVSQPTATGAMPALPTTSDASPASTPATSPGQTPDSKVLVLGSVFFPSNATQLGPDARRMLDGIANTYKGTAQALEIVGHADLRGSAQANMRLSAKRAEAVRGYLVQRGVPAANMTVSYDGARTPMAQGIDPEANAQNRRVEIRVP